MVPMEADLQNALMAKWYRKTVHASHVIDDMEGKGNWAVVGATEISYTRERCWGGQQSLRMRHSLRNEGHYRKSRTKWDSFSSSQGGDAAMELRFDTPQDWTAWNRVSLWVYVHKSAVPNHCFYLRLMCENEPKDATSPRPAHFVHDLKQGEWNQVLWEIGNLTRDKVNAFRIGQILYGAEGGRDGTVAYDFDQLELQQVDADQFEGWEVERGQIAFCHVGYRPGDAKIAMMNVQDAGERFEVVDEAGQVAFSEGVRIVRNRRGTFAELDFSAFASAGRYALRCGTVQSRPFAISEEVWLSPIAKALNFYFCQRCGHAVPGIHGECHQDVFGFHGEVRKCVNGGWHDAGDLSQGIFRTAMSVLAMMRLAETVGGENGRAIVNEATWGLKWILKTRFGGGYRMGWTTLRIYTDNVTGSCDDVVTPASNNPWENYLAAAAECEASRVLAASDAELARQALETAVLDWQDATATIAARGTVGNYLELAWAVSSSVLLHQATGEMRFLDEAIHSGRLLLECQETRFVDGIPIAGYFCADGQRKAPLHFHHAAFEEAPLIALGLLCERLPEHEDWIHWYAAAAMHSEYFLKRGSRSAAPYHHLPNSVWSRAEIEAQPEPRRDAMRRQFEEGTKLDANHALRTFPIYVDNQFHGNTHTQLSQTWALAEAARLRHDAAGMALVGRQLEWVFGGNPFAQSMMYGEGYDFAPAFAYCLKNIVGSLMVGMDSMHGDTPYWGPNNEATFKEIWVEPVNRFLGTMSVYLAKAKSRPGLEVRAIADGREVRISIRGCEGKKVRVRAYNMTLRELELPAGHERTCELQVVDADRPWVVVADAEGVERAEAIGARAGDLAAE